MSQETLQLLSRVVNRLKEISYSKKHEDKVLDQACSQAHSEGVLEATFAVLEMFGKKKPEKDENFSIHTNPPAETLIHFNSGGSTVSNSGAKSSSS